jgi:hypothetical protein
MKRACISCHKIEGTEKWKLSKEGFCPFQQSLVDLLRDNLEAAKVCGRKPPKRVRKCPACGAPREPFLWRPDSAWDYRDTCDCYDCPKCKKMVRQDSPCKHGVPLPDSAALHLVKQ